MPNTFIDGQKVKRWWVNGQEVKKAYIDGQLCFQKEAVVYVTQSDLNYNPNTLQDAMRAANGGVLNNGTFRIVVNPGVVIVGHNFADAPFIFHGIFNYKVTVENYGTVLGMGGNGGYGGGYNAAGIQAGFAGKNGILVAGAGSEVIIDNQGVIGGGGGGGGGCYVWWEGNGCDSGANSWGGAGGAPFGVGAWAAYHCSPKSPDATYDVSGIGTKIPSPWSHTPTGGGDGGLWGQSGLAGSGSADLSFQFPHGTISTTSGGNPGAAVLLTGGASVSLINRGTLYGDAP